MLAATRTAAVLGAGVAGGLAAGPAGAIAGGMWGGAAMDETVTVVDSVIHEEIRPHGLLKSIGDLVENPKDAGKWCDTIGGVAMDGASGYAAYSAYESYQKRRPYSELENDIGVEEARQTVKTGDIARKQHGKIQKVRDAGTKVRNAPEVTTGVQDLKKNKMHYGNNEQFCEVMAETTRGPGVSKAAARRAARYPEGSHSALQRRAFGEHQPPRAINRNPISCAEHRAYESFYKDPGANPQNSCVTTVRFDNKGNVVRALKRCNNCKMYDGAMGPVPTDMIDGRIIPSRSQIPGKYTSSAFAACGLVIGGLKKEEKKKKKRRRRRRTTTTTTTKTTTMKTVMMSTMSFDYNDFNNSDDVDYDVSDDDDLF